MTDLDSVPFHVPGEAPEQITTAPPTKCRHRGPRIERMIASEPEPVWATTCHRCGHVFDKQKQAKGRRVNNLAKDIERWVGRVLRLVRVGQFGGQADLGAAADWAYVQVKSGPAWFSERQYREIAALPVEAGKRRALVTVDKPGSGKPRRAMWIEILDEVPLPAAVAVRWEQTANGRLVCVNCGAGFPGHEVSCVHLAKEG